jgi:hypothetical protein
MNGIVRSISGFWPACGVLLVCSTAGCTSAISTAYLRDTFWESADHAAEPTSPDDTDDMQSAVADDTASDGLAPDEAGEIDEERRAAAIDEAVQRLAKLGDLDEATQTTLMETLQRTQQEDWPVVVEAFATSLEASGDSSRAAAEAVVERASASVRPASHVVAKADLDETATRTSLPPAEPVAAAVTAAPAPPEPMPVNVESEATTVPIAPETVVPVEPVPSLAVRNACFASRVQAWGVVDRFVESQFRPGQELIVYFELDNLSAGESPAGHTTCIDATLTLVDGDGRTVHDWSFEPIAETCRAKRHDYFARYVIRIPESVQAGDCRIDVAVVDTLAGTTARASLPLGIVN